MTPRLRLFIPVAAVALLAAAPRVARAQASFDAELMHAQVTSNGYLSLDGAFVAPHLGVALGLTMSYAHDPLVLRSREGRTSLIAHQLGADVALSLGLIERLEIGVALPFMLYQDVRGERVGVKDSAAAGIGDVRIDLKGLLWAPRFGHHRFGLSLILGITAPSGDTSSFLGQGSPTGRPRLVAEWRAPWMSLALEIGGVIRTTRRLGDLAVSSQVSYGLGARVRLGAGFSVTGELSGLVGVGLPDGIAASVRTAPLEVAGGFEWRAANGLVLALAGGGGLTRGYGAPDGRIIAGLRWTMPAKRREPPREPDGDHDGVPDRLDRCPTLAAPGEPDGCPATVRDRDGDGVVDANDRCPLVVGPAENNGCPDGDRDRDGVVDRLDRCPDEPGLGTADGCPLPDRDHDGVPDVDDRCPDKPGVRENQGCADFDSDGDGIVDRLDRCPFEAEVFNGVRDDDGCPDAPAAIVTIGSDRVLVTEGLWFGGDDGATLDARGERVLAIVAKVLTLHPELLKLRIEPRADRNDDPALTSARAAAVRRWLVEHGVRGGRLSSDPVPTTPPAAPPPRVRRRVDLIIMQRLDG